MGVCCCFDLGDVRVPGLYSLVLVRLLVVEGSGEICAAADLVSRPPFAGVTGAGGGGMVLIDLFLPVSSMKLEGVWAAADFHGGEGGPLNFRFLEGFRSWRTSLLKVESELRFWAVSVSTCRGLVVLELLRVAGRWPFRSF